MSTIIPENAAMYIGTKIYLAKLIVTKYQKLSEGVYTLESKIVKEITASQDNLGKWVANIIFDDGSVIKGVPQSSAISSVWYYFESTKMNQYNVHINSINDSDIAVTEGIYFSEDTVKDLKELLENNLTKYYNKRITEYESEISKLNDKISDYQFRISEIKSKI